MILCALQRSTLSVYARGNVLEENTTDEEEGSAIFEESSDEKAGGGGDDGLSDEKDPLE